MCRCGEHLVLLDCPLPPLARQLLTEGQPEAHVALVSEHEATGLWEPLIKARIKGLPRHNARLPAGHGGALGLCTSALSGDKAPYLVRA